MMSLRLGAVAIILGAGVLGTATPAVASDGGISVITYFSGNQTVHPGDVIFVDVSVSTFDRGTTVPVSMKLWAHRGKVIGFADLGYPVQCSVVNGAGRCVTDAPMSAGHGFELSVEVRVGPHAASGAPASRMTSLTGYATAPPDHMWGIGTASIPVTPA